MVRSKWWVTDKTFFIFARSKKEKNIYRQISFYDIVLLEERFFFC
jgi:hypothetical protein